MEETTDPEEAGPASAEFNWTQGVSAHRSLHHQPGSSGPASLTHLGNSDGSPGLEYDLWEGQFEFLGATAPVPTRHPPIYSGRAEHLQPMHQQIQMIEGQMHALTDTQAAGEERYARVKQENATLQARILMLEEAARDAEARAEEKLETEQRRHREWTSRLEREKELQLENCSIKLQAVELECSRARDEAVRLREQQEKLRAEKSRLENALEEAHLEVKRVRDAERKAALGLVESNRELKRMEEELTQRMDLERRNEELIQEIEALKNINKGLKESRDELQAAATALQAGRELLIPGAQDPNDNTINRKNSPSLATELLLTGSPHDQADGIDTGKSGANDNCDNITTLAEAKQALKREREVSARLRVYIDGLILNIVENYPQLLEVKQVH